MSIKYLSQIESDTITEQPIRIPFEFNNKQSIPKDKDPGDNIVIRPITVSTWFRIRPLLLAIEKDDFDKLISREGAIDKEFAFIMDKYGELLIDIICLGIHNKPTTSPAWFKQVLIDNCTWEDIAILLNAILYRIGYFPFCKSITLLRNVSPLDEVGLIAAQMNIESWQGTIREDS